MDLKLTTERKPRETDKTAERRGKLIQQIDNQKSKVADAETGTANRGAWFWQMSDGSYLLSIRYGRLDLELSKGMFSIACEDLSAVKTTLEKVRKMALAGDLDDALEKASAALRAKFKKSK